MSTLIAFVEAAKTNAIEHARSDWGKLGVRAHEAVVLPNRFIELIGGVDEAPQGVA